MLYIYHTTSHIPVRWIVFLEIGCIWQRRAVGFQQAVIDLKMLMLWTRKAKPDKKARWNSRMKQESEKEEHIWRSRSSLRGTTSKCQSGLWGKMRKGVLLARKRTYVRSEQQKALQDKEKEDLSSKKVHLFSSLLWVRSYSLPAACLWSYFVNNIQLQDVYLSSSPLSLSLAARPLLGRWTWGQKHGTTVSETDKKNTLQYVYTSYRVSEFGVLLFVFLELLNHGMLSVAAS